MKFILRAFFTFLLIISAFICFAYLFWYKPKFKTTANSHKNTIEKESKEFKKLEERSVSLKQFAAAHNYNVSLAFLIDMSLESGKNRFFVYNMDKDSVLKEGLVAHGSCDAGFQIDPTFSNTVNSGCSALGRYKIGNAYKAGLDLLINYMDLILQITMLLNEISFYILMIVYPNRKLILFQFAIAGAVQWFPLAF